jgi:hypothetical protein
METEPTHRRDRRRGHRRAAATLAAAAAIVGTVGTVQAVSTEPADASYGCYGSFGWFWDTTGNCYYDEYIWYLIGGTGDYYPQEDPAPVVTLPTIPLSQEASDALDVTEEGLQTPDCNTLITGDTERYGTPFERLRDRKTDKDKLVEKPKEDAPRGVGQPASTAGVGVFSRTTLYKAFYDPLYSPEIFERPPNEPLNEQELQVLTIFHELAHATGKLPDDSAGPPKEFNSRILEVCMGIATFVPPVNTPPAPPPNDRPPCPRTPCPWSIPQE